MIPAAGSPPVDGPGVQFDVGQFVCANPTISGDVEIRCPVSTFADDVFTTFQWTKAGDPSFSFSGEVLSLPRSEASSAGDYTCTIISGPNGECGVTNQTSTVASKKEKR